MMTFASRFGSCVSYAERARRLTQSVLLAGLLVAAGCDTFSDPDDDLADDLRRAEARWTRASVLDYQVVVRNSCFCGYTRPVRLTVSDGVVVSKVDAETGEPAPPFANARDIPELFDLIRDALARDAYSLNVTYDADYGFPVQINIDYIGNAVDDELNVSVSGFQPTS
jgi:hypothetical protein